MNINGTMIYVYKLPAALSDGYCFGSGKPITFQNVDWFNGFDGMKREHLEGFVRGKQYATNGDKLLVLSPENDLSFTINI
jgi:hypothetical protein